MFCLQQSCWWSDSGCRDNEWCWAIAVRTQCGRCYNWPRWVVVVVLCALLAMMTDCIASLVSSSNTAVTKSAAVEYSDRILTVSTLSRSFAEYCKHFVARFNHVHASGYNSARSVRIRMKFGALRVYCLELARADFGRDPCRSDSGRSSRNLVSFCEVNNARLCRFPVSQISRNLHTRRASMLPGILSENICEYLP